MQLYAEYVLGKGGGGYVGETIQKEGLRAQLDNVTNYKEYCLGFKTRPTSNSLVYAALIFIFRVLFQPCVALFQLTSILKQLESKGCMGTYY